MMPSIKTCSSCAILLLFLLLSNLSELQAGNNPGSENKDDASADTTLREKRIPCYRIMVDAGYGHWVSDRFRTAALGTDLGFGVRFNPGLKWLQLSARHDYSTIRITDGDTLHTSYDGRHIGFTSVELALCTEFRRKNQSLMAGISMGAVFVAIQGRDLVTGASGCLHFDYLFYLPPSTGLAVGVSLSLLNRTYNITDTKEEPEEWYSSDKVNLDRDFNTILGVVVSYTFPSASGK